VVDAAQARGVYIDWRRHAATGIPVTLVTLVISWIYLWPGYCIESATEWPPCVNGVMKTVFLAILFCFVAGKRRGGATVELHQQLLLPAGGSGQGRGADAGRLRRRLRHGIRRVPDEHRIHTYRSLRPEYGSRRNRMRCTAEGACGPVRHRGPCANHIPAVIGIGRSVYGIAGVPT